MWRFLALEAADEWITVNDADRGKDILSDVERSEQAMATTTWPSYGFDEWFLLAVMYPRLAFEGVQTFFHWRFPELSFCHTLDVEYVTWANPGSEVFHCPKPPAGDLEPWERGEVETTLTVREKTAVIRRERERIGPAHRILAQAPAAQIEGIPTFQGCLADQLGWVGSEVSDEYCFRRDRELGCGDGVGGTAMAGGRDSQNFQTGRPYDSVAHGVFQRIPAGVGEHLRFYEPGSDGQGLERARPGEGSEHDCQVHGLERAVKRCLHWKRSKKWQGPFSATVRRMERERLGQCHAAASADWPRVRSSFTGPARRSIPAHRSFQTLSWVFIALNPPSTSISVPVTKGPALEASRRAAPMSS